MEKSIPVINDLWQVWKSDLSFARGFADGREAEAYYLRKGEGYFITTSEDYENGIPQPIELGEWV
ncbi:hypothetical protein [Lederbergia lenta]|uniref:hypothetical protein n=1 Tax=Lederbergia lenta TaxID=1467 RepID=UPI002041E587|nr:hypothetical protein [Lederbergia lenta]MCM3110001.1 hypothetical protein [Lederbergia lenta]